ncbi:hypothetical protein K469DRAFT_705022 [Zopfia rhizophila CBS 207.26]|uniref:Uncharacterized protein n=1 Tax=Zopfia rhizophila CBS 207.26 TaxID=1314779 RepID=A0A6A6E9U1_9PEZI|nr:hypothetical protein K469DRAFT_705022 [Zopfia rhizophila CBS 207.26]
MGCAWKNITDADIDRLMERTRSRHMARRASSVPMAHFFAAGFDGGLDCDIDSISPGAGRLGAYAVSYPYRKRVSNYAQVWVGNTLGWNVLLGSATAGFDV